MIRRHAALTAVLSAALLLTGCGAAGDAAGNAASAAASQAASAVAQEVTKQICARVQDGLVSVDDKKALAGLVSAAREAGVPAEITTPLGDVAASGDQVPADSVKALNDACPA
ncbi:hypothetical protein ACX5I6_04895 [Arthrobacter sp. MMS24-T111]